MSLFLDPADIERLTGKKYAPAQKRALDKRGIRYTEDAHGRPVVLRASVERKILGRAETPEPAAGPDFSAFPRVA